MINTTEEFEYPNDLNKVQNVKVFVAKTEPIEDGRSRLVKSSLLFTYKYIPLIPEEERNKLFDIYGDSKILKDILNGMDDLFNFLFRINVSHFSNRIVSSVNIKKFLINELEFYRSNTSDVENYPILKHIDPNTLQNISFIKNINILMEIAERKNISDLNVMQYEDYSEENFNINTPETNDFKKLKNCVVNIAWQRFEDFIEEELRKENIDTKDNFNTKNNKDKSEFTKQIIFDSPETITKLHIELKGQFPEKEVELLNALKGENLTDKILFPSNANRFVEVFKRLKYNGLLISTPTEVKEWICKNFNYVKIKGKVKSVEILMIVQFGMYLQKLNANHQRKIVFVNRIGCPLLNKILEKKKQKKKNNKNTTPQTYPIV
jgi:hypothetical protein